MEKFNPRIEVHNGEGLTITVRPDNEKFSTLDVNESEIKLAFGDEDIENDHTVKWKDQSMGKSEITDDIFMRSKQPIILSPIDGEIDWLGELNYKPNIGNIAIDGAILKIQISETNDFKNPFEKVLDNNGNNFKIDFPELKYRFGFGTRVYMRLSNLLPNDYEIVSTVTTVNLYDSFNVRLVDTPLDSTGTWMGEVEYEYSIAEELKQYTTVEIEVSDNVDFTDCYSEEISDKNNHTLNYNKLIEKFGYGTSVYVRTKITSLGVSKVSSANNVSVMNLTMNITYPRNGSNEWLGMINYDSSIRKSENFNFEDYILQISKHPDFNDICLEKNIQDDENYINISSSEIYNIGTEQNVYIRMKVTINSTIHYSNTIETTTHWIARILITQIPTENGMWIGGISYRVELASILNNSNLFLEVSSNEDFQVISDILEKELNKDDDYYDIQFNEIADKFGVNSDGENNLLYIRIKLICSDGNTFYSQIERKKLYNGISPTLTFTDQDLSLWSGYLEYNTGLTKSMINLFNVTLSINGIPAYTENISNATGIKQYDMDRIFDTFGIKKDLDFTMNIRYDGKTIRTYEKTINFDYKKTININLINPGKISVDSRNDVYGTYGIQHTFTFHSLLLNKINNSTFSGKTRIYDGRVLSYNVDRYYDTIAKQYRFKVQILYTHTGYNNEVQVTLNILNDAVTSNQITFRALVNDFGGMG